MADLVFPTKGPQTTWILTEEWRQELEKLFPDSNLDLEFSVMLAWLEKNGPKTARGMKLFVLNWLRRSKKASTYTFSGNHDVLPPPKQPPKTNGDAERRRIELWKAFREQGMTDSEAKAASYQAWLAEGFGKA